MPHVVYALLIYQYTFIMKLIEFLTTCFPFSAGTSLIG
jgi:hypothetical protein